MKEGGVKMDNWTICEIEIVKAQVRLQRTPNAEERTRQLRYIMEYQRLQKEITNNNPNN